MVETLTGTNRSKGITYDALLDMEGLPPTDERGLREYRAVQAEIEALRGTADAGEEDELFADLTASD